MNGWLYCVTNLVFKQNNLYKIKIIPFHTKNTNIKHRILSHYNNIFSNPEICYLSPISHSDIVDNLIINDLFKYRNSFTEMVRVDYDNIILPVLLEKTKLYPINKIKIIEDEEYNRLIKKIEKNINYYKMQNTLNIYMFMHILNKYNNAKLHNIYIKLKNNESITKDIQTFDKNDPHIHKFLIDFSKII